MSKTTVEVYNISSDTESTYIEDDDEKESTDDEYIINKNNKTNVFLNFNLELEPFYFNNLSVNINLNIPIFYNVPYTLFKKYKLGCCFIIDDDNIYYYIRDALKIPDASILDDLIEIQFNLY